MKRIIFPKLVSALMIFGAFTFVHEGLHQAMIKMMDKMKSMKMSGDPDKDFAMMMIEHHQGGIDMAQIAVKSTRDEKIKAFSQKLLSTQPQEQKDLRQHATPHQDQSNSARSESASSSNEFSTDMKNLMDQTDSKLRSMKMTDDVDHDFAAMMIEHHKDAIKMSDAEIKHGKVSEVKSLAEKIKSDSEKDISELQGWLDSHNKK